MFTQIVRICEEEGLSSVKMKDNGYSIELNQTEDIRSFSFVGWYVLMLTEKGIRELLDALGNCQQPNITGLVDKINETFHLIRQWEQDRSSRDRY